MPLTESAQDFDCSAGILVQAGERIVPFLTPRPSLYEWNQLYTGAVHQYRNVEHTVNAWWIRAERASGFTRPLSRRT
jgi:hypothetical protein